MLGSQNILKWFGIKNKAYYQTQLFQDNTKFYEYLSETNLDSNNREDYKYINKHRRLIFNSISAILVKNRDDVFIKLNKQFSVRIVPYMTIIFINFLVSNTLVFKFWFSSRESQLFNIFLYAVCESIYCGVLSLIFYYLAYKTLITRMCKYLYDLCDEDLQEFNQSYGKNVFGSNFFSEYDDSGKGYKIQIFKDKTSDTINAVCVTQPIIEVQDKITLKIGFMGTLTDEKLQLTILNKMVDKVFNEQDKLKQDYPGLKISVELVSRLIDRDAVDFLNNFKDFKFDRYETNEFRFLRGFNKKVYTRD